MIDGVEVTPENVEELTTYKRESNTRSGSRRPYSYPTVLLGDVDGNKLIDVRDGVLIKQYLAQMGVEINETNSDVDEKWKSRFK